MAGNRGKAAARPAALLRTAGKRPALRPQASQPGSKSKITKPSSSPRRITGAAAATKKAHSKNEANAPLPWYTATRRINTRSQAKIFHLMALPSELRNGVWELMAAAFSETTPIDLETLTLPPALSLSKQARTEVLPFFFSANRFHLRVRSNYCVYQRHFHVSGHLRYGRAGKVTLSPVLTGDIVYSPAALDKSAREEPGDEEAEDQDSNEDGSVSSLMDGRQHDNEEGDEDEEGLELREECIRFRDVSITVDCVCCDDGKRIALLELSVAEGSNKPKVNCKYMVTSDRGLSQQTTGRASLELIFADVRARVEEIGRREEFNGFSVEDLKAVAKCAKHKKQKPVNGGV